MQPAQTPDVLHRVIGSQPVRNALSWIGSTDSGVNLLNRVARERGIYATFNEAQEAAKHLNAKGHEAELLSQLPLNYGLRMSDYPVLVWLNQVRPQRLFDFGGSVGNLYYLYKDYLDLSPPFSWIVHDLPEVIEKGQSLAATRDASTLSFSSRLSDGKDCDFFLVSGALQFWEPSMATLFAAMGTRPEHVIVNRSPLTERKLSYVILDIIGNAALPKMIRSRSGLIEEFESLGYERVADWIEPERRITLTFYPGYEVPNYSGLYFRLKKADALGNGNAPHA
jgi:putative methyltransferase (TIGR04325 family)